MEFIPHGNFDKEICQFVGIGLFNNPNTFENRNAVGIAWADDVKGIIAGFVFHDYTPDSQTVELSAYSSHSGWCTRGRGFKAFLYPFENFKGVRLLYGRHDERNKRVRATWRVLGGRETVIPDLRGDGVGEVFSTLRHEDLLNNKYMR